MRPKVIAVVLLMVLVVLIAGFLLHVPTPRSETSTEDSSATSTDSSAKPPEQPRVPRRPNSKTEQAAIPAANPASPEASTTESAEDRHSLYVQTRASELMELAGSDDADSLHTILSELTNRDPEIRRAAVQAAIQFDSQDAIPALMDAATQTDDSHEKAEIEDAINFLKLPSMTQLLAQRQLDPTLPLTMSAATNAEH